MANFLHDIEQALNGEVVEGIVLGTRGPLWGRDEALTDRQVRSWDEVKAQLDYEYDAGYGCEDCHALWIWTPTRVLFICCYDGSTWVSGVPRNPTPGGNYTPGFYGGG